AGGDDTDRNAPGRSYAAWRQKNAARPPGSIPTKKGGAPHRRRVYAALAKPGLSDRTRLHAHRVVSTMLKHATQWGVVPRNVANMVSAPRVKGRELEILTPAQVQTVLGALRGKSLYLIALVLLTT